MFIPRSYYKLVEFIEKVIELKCKPVDTILENMARRCRVRKNLLVHGKRWLLTAPLLTSPPDSHHHHRADPLGAVLL